MDGESKHALTVSSITGISAEMSHMEGQGKLSPSTSVPYRLYHASASLF